MCSGRRGSVHQSRRLPLYLVWVRQLKRPRCLAVLVIFLLGEDDVRQKELVARVGKGWFPVDHQPVDSADFRDDAAADSGPPFDLRGGGVFGDDEHCCATVHVRP